MTRALDLEKRLLGQWNSLIRRARISRDYKAAALTMSSYADADGDGIRLSVARYAVDLNVSYSTARRYMTWMRKVGLLEMTHMGNRRKMTASEYRLILGPDVLELLDVLTPGQQKTFTDEIREAERNGSKARGQRRAQARKSPDQRSPGTSVDNDAPEAGTDANQRSPEEALIDPINAQMASDQRSPWMTYTPSRKHLSDLGRPSRADDEDLGAAVTLSREEPAVVVEIRPGVSQEAPYRPPPRWSTRGQSEIAAASARAAARREAHQATKEAN